jgi:hypothetical protein
LHEYDFSERYLSTSNERANLLEHYDESSDFAIVLNINKVNATSSNTDHTKKNYEKLQKKHKQKTKNGDFLSNDNVDNMDGPLSCKLSFILKD